MVAMALDDGKFVVYDRTEAMEGEQTLKSLKIMRAWASINNFAIFVTYIDNIKMGKKGFKYQV